VKAGRILLNPSWFNYYPDAAFVDRQIATCVAYVNAFDFATLPAERTSLSINPVLSAGVELTNELIEAAFRQVSNYTNNGEALNGSGWSVNINAAGLGVSARKEVLKIEIAQKVCRAVYTLTLNSNPPPEYLREYFPCQSAVEPSGVLNATVLVGPTDAYVQSTSLRQSVTRSNGIWVYNAFPVVAPACCNFAP